MIENTKFPNIDDPLLAQFTKCKKENMQFFDEDYSRFLMNVYSSWLNYFKASSTSQLCSMFLSAELSNMFNLWENAFISKLYSPEDDIPSNGVEFKSSFHDTNETILDINADTGKIKDTSPNGNTTVLNTANVTIENDSIYGNVMHFYSNQVSNFIDLLPYIEVQGDYDNPDKFHMKVSTGLDDDSYVMFVFAKLNSIRKIDIGSGKIDQESNSVTFLRKFDGMLNNSNLYRFTLSTNNTTFKPLASPITFDETIPSYNPSFSWANRHQNIFNGDGTVGEQTNFKLKNLENQWTLYAIELTHAKSLNENTDTNYFQQWYAINPTISSYITVNGELKNPAGYDNCNYANFPGSRYNAWQFNNVSNSEIMKSSGIIRNAGTEDFISRSLTDFSMVQAKTDPYNNLLKDFNNDTFKSEPIFIGIDNDNEFYHYLQNADIKYVKIMKIKPSCKFNYLASREYYLNCFLPRINKTLGMEIDNVEDVFNSSNTMEDSSIEGKYVKFTNAYSPVVPLPETTDLNVFNKSLKKSLTIAMWISCDNICGINAFINEKYDYMLSIFMDDDKNNYARISNGNYNLSANIGDFYFGKWYGKTEDQIIDSKNRFTTYSNEDLNVSEADKFLDNSRLPFSIQNDERWHHLAFTFQYPNTETTDASYDSNNVKFVVYLDGRSICKKSQRYFIVDNLIPKNNVVSQLDSSKQNAILFNPANQSFNLRSFELYIGDTEKGEFLQDQDIFNLYIRDKDKYFSRSKNTFKFTQYLIKDEDIENNNYNDVFINKKYSDIAFNTHHQFFQWDYDYLNICDATTLCLLNYSSAIWNGKETIEQFPCIMNGYPHPIQRSLIEINGGNFSIHQGTYLLHFNIDDFLSAEMYSIDNGTQEKIPLNFVTYNANNWNYTRWVDTFGICHGVTSFSVQHTHVFSLSGHYDLNENQNNPRGMSNYLHLDIMKWTGSESDLTALVNDATQAESYYNANLENFEVIKSDGVYGE